MRMEREHFLFARKPGADTRMEKEEIDVDILDRDTYFPCRFSVTYGTA